MTRPEHVQCLISIAESFIGITEKGGDNKGPEVEKFQKAVNGIASREAWCMCFVQYCVMATETKFKTDSKIFASEHCMTVWNNTDKELKFQFPKAGDIVIWQYWKDGKPTSSGHTGIVTLVSGDIMDTIEGNTGPGSEVVREGDGVYRKSRSVKGSSKMKVVGFIRPF